MSLRCFRSKAGADVLMLGAHADAVLPLFGREAASEGVFLHAQIDDALRAYAAAQPMPPIEPAEQDEPLDESPDLMRRAWPLLDLLRRALANGHTVTWTST